MGRRILVFVLLLIVVGFAYVGYNRYDAKRAGANGDVFSADPITGNTKADTETSNPPNTRTAERQPVTSAPDGQTTQTTQTVPDDQTQTALPGRSSAGSGTDTISPNPPNGMVFSGTGRYQLYRQGNLTWRLNSDTGQSCILFATDEEWKKPKVYRAGCGNH